MRTKAELNYRDYVQQENNILHAPYNPELEFYAAIKAGDTRKVKLLCQEPLKEKEGLGILSENSLRNMKYHFVITTALVARHCIEGGMELATAYSLSDYYIKKADSFTQVNEISTLHPIMCMDYTKRMKNLRKQKICSRPIASCIDYICENLNTRITVDTLSKYVGLNPSYLSRLFKKEVGVPISTYILEKKVETAKNMLVYSNYTPAQIATTLAFPNQSYFTEQFRKMTGITPKKYQTLNFRSSGIGNE